MNFDDTMYDRYISAIYFEYNNLSGSDGLIMVIGEEQEVSSIECWLHASTTTKRADHS